MCHVDLLKYLISRGLPVDVPDIVGFTALAHSVMNWFPQLTLLGAGANVNHQNRYGEVALFAAFQHNHTAAMNLLCEYGANFDIKEADGLSPMTFFLQCGPQVTATVRKWINKRSGEKAPRLKKTM
jgi:ankyrin repeat protein